MTLTLRAKSNLDSPRRRAGLAALPIVAVMLAVSGCSGGSSNDSAGSAAAPTTKQNAVGVAGVAMDAPDQESQSLYRASAVSDTSLTSRALIKTAAVSLESDDIPGVIAKIDGLAAKTAGLIASEDTATNTHGVVVRSRIVVSVPSGVFEQAVDKITGFGNLVSRTQGTQDVTGRVADVASRVTSAKDSIAQLRTLFRQATKLGQVIDLERELSDREANLEALLAQQRSLAASTTMSTITVNVSQPSETTTHHTNAHTGFWTGLKQGWHAMFVFVLAFAHGLGLVLPLGVIAVLAALLAFVVIRRFMPRREAHTSE